MTETADENIRLLLAETGCRDAQDLIDMAKVGQSLMESIASVVTAEGPFKGWVPADDPAEIVVDLVNALNEARDKAIADFLAQDAVFEVLQLMNFRTGPVAHVFQKSGEPIRNRCEDEQAWVLRWMLGLVAQHGDAWREQVSQELDRRIAVIEAAAEAKKAKP